MIHKSVLSFSTSQMHCETYEHIHEEWKIETKEAKN